MKEQYQDSRAFRKTALLLIAVCDKIVNEYVAQGFRLTVRQIYYQLVARGHVENTVQSYNNVQALLNNARLAGLIDWDAIEDRTRGMLTQPHWKSGGHILRSVAEQFHMDLWDDQTYRVFVVVEKEALAGVLQRVCDEFDMPLLPARGYPSGTTLREFAKERIMLASQQIVVLHLGDHDPSGMDMSRDLEDRLNMFARHRVEIDFRRIALNMDQVKEQSPPPNPAKITDSRYEKYREQFGEESWELDALSPAYLHELVTKQVNDLIDWDEWNDTLRRIDATKERLRTLSADFDKE